MNVRLVDRQGSMTSSMQTIQSIVKVPAAVTNTLSWHFSPSRPNIFASSQLISPLPVKHWSSRTLLAIQDLFGNVMMVMGCIPLVIL